MFKNQSIKKKTNQNLVMRKDVSENSNFKSGSITFSGKSKRMKSLTAINSLSGFPSKNESIRIVTQKNINSFDFILSIIEKENRIDELIIAFYRIGKKVISELKSFQENNEIGYIYFLVNDGFPKLVPESYNALKSNESKNWKIALTNTHTKIILAKTKQFHYVIEGSGNLSQNARIEQYSFDNDEDLFNFHKNWITKF